MAELVAKRYAQALFEAGEDLSKTDEFYENLKSLDGILQEEPKLLDLLSHPKISKKEKKDLIDTIFEKNMVEEVRNFIYILIDKKREKNLPDILKIYEDLYYQDRGILRVVAVTAVPMKDEAKDKLSQVLGSKLDKKIEIKNQIDKSIIGGVRLELEGKLIDGSIKGKLDSMARTFRAATN